MQTFLTNTVLFTAIAFATLMATDFILGLIHLAHTKSNPAPAKSNSVTAQPQPRPEDVFKLIDELEKTIPTETEAEKPVPSLVCTNVPTDAPSPQFSTVGSTSIDYESMTIRELKGLASSLHIPYYSRKRKAELIEAIRCC